jgi:anti-anti-sigma regulatory factor
MGTQEWSENILLVELAQEPKMNEELKLLINRVRTEEKYHVVIDFSSVDVITSSSLIKLLKLRKLLVDQEHRLVFSTMFAATMGIFTVTGLDKFFEFTNDRFVALANLSL